MFFFMAGLSIAPLSYSSVFPVRMLSFILNFKQLSSLSISGFLRSGLQLVINGELQAPFTIIDVLFSGCFMLVAVFGIVNSSFMEFPE